MSERSTRLHLTLFVLTLLSCFEATAQKNFLDSSFNQDGICTEALASMAWASCTTLDSQNKILVAGFAYIGNWRFALMRLNPDGSLDSTLGTTGKISTPNINGGDMAFAVATGPKGKTTLAGFYFDTGVVNDHFAVMRYLANGDPDSTFGKNGVVYDTVIFGRASSLLVQHDEKTIVVGSGAFSKTEVSGFMMLRLLPDGNPDTTFGNDGYVRTTLGGQTSASSALLLPDGKIIVGGSGLSYFKLARYNNDGQLDSAFGNNGLVEVDVSTNSNQAEASALIRRADGSAILAGNTGGNRPVATMICVRTDGSLNQSFGKSGVVSDSAIGPIMYVSGAVQLSDGEIVVGGFADDSVHSNFAIARYFSNGTLDRNFGTNGMSMSQVGTSYSYTMGMTVQPDDKIVAAGWSWGTVATNEFAVVRYQSLTPLTVNSSNTISKRIKVYPNPVSTTLNLECETSSQRDLNYNIRSVDGKQILSGNFKSKAILDLNSLAVGTYLLTITSGDFVESRLIMKN